MGGKVTDLSFLDADYADASNAERNGMIIRVHPHFKFASSVCHLILNLALTSRPQTPEAIKEYKVLLKCLGKNENVWTQNDSDRRGKHLVVLSQSKIQSKSNSQLENLLKTRM